MKEGLCSCCWEQQGTSTPAMHVFACPDFGMNRLSTMCVGVLAHKDRSTLHCAVQQTPSMPSPIKRECWVCLMRASCVHSSIQSFTHSFVQSRCVLTLGQLHTALSSFLYEVLFWQSTHQQHTKCCRAIISETTLFFVLLVHTSMILSLHQQWSFHERWYFSVHKPTRSVYLPPDTGHNFAILPNSVWSVSAAGGRKA